MDFWKVVESRHSVRDYRPDPVPRELVDRALAAASAAPSAMNLQPWRFHVATGDARQRVGEIVSSATMHLAEYMDVLGPDHYEDAVKWYSSLGDAPIVVVVSCLKSDNEFDASNKWLSVGCAIENFLLATTVQGLASCNITFAWWVRDELAQFLQVDEGREILAIIAVGYPGEAPVVSHPHNPDVADWYE